jgi:hypothetical protein
VTEISKNKSRILKKRDLGVYDEKEDLGLI